LIGTPPITDKDSGCSSAGQEMEVSCLEQNYEIIVNGNSKNNASDIHGKFGNKIFISSFFACCIGLEFIR
jgi:hypothetical protein